MRIFMNGKTIVFFRKEDAKDLHIGPMKIRKNFAG